MSIFDLENRLPLLKRTATLSLKLPKVTTLCPPIPTIPPGHHLVPTYPYNSPRSPPCAQLSLQLPQVTTLCPPIPTTPPGHHTVPTYTYNSLSAPPPSSCWSSRWREKKVVLVISEKERGRYTPPLLLSLTLHSHTHGGSEKVGSQHLIKQSSPGWNDVLFQNPPRAERIFFSLIFVKKLSVVHYNSWGLNPLIILQYLYYLLRYGYFVCSVFFTVYSYLMTNFCKFCIEHSLWPFELRSVGIFKISLTVYEI